MVHEQYKSQGPASVRLIEECAEVQQAMTKVLRFGLLNFYPDTNITNREQVLLEMQDVVIAWNDWAREQGFPTLQLAVED